MHHDYDQDLTVCHNLHAITPMKNSWEQKLYNTAYTVHCTHYIVFTTLYIVCFSHTIVLHNTQYSVPGCQNLQDCLVTKICE